MSFADADEVIKAVLYEGYVLYPYRPTSIRNRQRWTFGGVYPPACPAAGAAVMEVQFLVAGDTAARLEVRVRFLQPQARQISGVVPAMTTWPDEVEPTLAPVASLECEGRSYYTWEESIERELSLVATTLGDLEKGGELMRFEFAASRTSGPITTRDGRIVGAIVRSQEATSGRVTVGANRVDEGAWRVDVRIENTSAMPAARVVTRDEAQARAFMSTHIVVGVEGGAFVSLIDPPPALAEAARACTNRSAWPILVGAEGSHDTLLCSPIILYDHPEIAPGSPANPDDGTEIDEVLTLRVLAMTDAAKAGAMPTAERGRARPAGADAPDTEHDANTPLHRLASLDHGGTTLRVGDRVRLDPRTPGDIFDLALAGQVAVIESIEVDFENRVHVVVTVASDSGRDRGEVRMPGHRFFFSPDEIRSLGGDEAPR